MTVTSQQCGRWLCFDGHKPHLSEHFQGERYSIVAFLHNSTETLSHGDRAQLHELGFNLPTLPDPVAPASGDPASGPQKLLGEMPTFTEGNAMEPKPTVEPKPSEVEQQEHHPEAPVRKRTKTNLQIGEALDLTPDQQHNIECLLQRVDKNIDLGACTKDGFTRVSTDTQQHAELLRVLNNTMSELLG